MGLVDRNVIPKLLPLLKDKEEGVRRAATEALRKIDPKALPRTR
jgi:HEAT repeat protein